MPEYFLVFENAALKNPFDYDIVLNGSFNKKTGALKFNFLMRGVGPICRVEVNGAIHGDAGRTHKHDIRKDSDPRMDLPHAEARPDLIGKTPKEVWEDLCKRAKIEHTGNFVDPSD